MGVLLSLLSAAFSSAKDLLSKRLAFRLDGMTSTFASFAYALPYYVVVLGVLIALDVDTVSWSTAFLTLVVLRSITDTLAEGMKMYAFAHGDISIIATFFSMSPLFLLITSPLITGDVPSVVGSIAVILVVGGSMLILYRPSSASWAGQKKGILLALGASFFFSLNSCFDRLAVQQGNPVYAGFTMTLLSGLLLMPLVVFRADRRRALREHRGGLWARGFLELAFMVAKLYALQYLSAPDVAGILRMSLLFSILGGRVFFREEDFLRRLLAGLFILGGVFLIASQEW